MTSEIGMPSMHDVADDYSDDLDVLLRDHWRRLEELSDANLNPGLVGLPGLGGSHRNSVADMIQDDISCSTSSSRRPSHPTSHAVDVPETSESQFAHCQHNLTSLDTLHSCANIAGLSKPNISLSGSRNYASALGTSLSSSTTPDPQCIARAPNPCIPTVGGGKISSLESRNVPNLPDDISPCNTVPMDLVAGLSGMRLSMDNMVDEGNHPRMHIEIDKQMNFLNLLKQQNHVRQHSQLNTSSGLPNGTYLKGLSTPSLSSGGSSPSQHPNFDSPSSVFSGYGMNSPPPTMLKNQLEGGLSYLSDTLASGTAMGGTGIDFPALGGGINLGPNLLAAAAELQNLSRLGNQSLGNSFQNHLMDPLYLQSLMSNEYAAALNDPTYINLLELRKDYLSALLASQRSQYGLPCSSRTGGLGHGLFGSSTLGGISYPGSPLAGYVLPNSPYGPDSPFRERNMHFPSGTRNLAGGVTRVWQPDPVSNNGGNFTPSLLDEFKINKTRCYTLSDIEDHVIQFSADQYGSRFIQQKLETSTVEEKNMVFHEIVPHALSLMTDVFGNYVVQKFFELGSKSQIRELAGKLTGHVLTLSLQMYGCRVIQKAVEVVDLDQKKTMVSELDGHIMRCVRDQNGNHVIQKCIECVPEDAIKCIVTSFYDQVVTLSTHPYGCRVIQRVLEHCRNPETQKRIVSEILQSVSILAHDQYGNYVVQHVLEHGKPEERSVIINKLLGQIVQMSQQKFASNVVEKCLTFGTPEERQILVNEMLGSTDNYDPLQVLMKDQFANYVVQKVLETCDDQQLELILKRIKVHLNILRRYTYGKHIVARVEKLVATGERRILLSNEGIGRKLYS